MTQSKCTSLAETQDRLLEELAREDLDIEQPFRETYHVLGSLECQPKALYTATLKLDMSAILSRSYLLGQVCLGSEVFISRHG